MLSQIEKNVPTIKYENEIIDFNKEYIQIIKLIKENINIINNNNDNNNIDSFMEIFLKRYFSDCSEESFILKIKQGLINKTTIKNIINSKTDIKHDYTINYNNQKKKKYSDITIITFIEIIIENYDLEDDYKLVASNNNLSDVIDYLLYLNNCYYEHKINRNLLIELLNLNVHSKYYLDLLKFYSYELKIKKQNLTNLQTSLTDIVKKFNSTNIDLNKFVNFDLIKEKISENNEIDQNIRKKFLKCLNDLYFDRSDGYYTKPLDLTKETIIPDLNLYNEMMNRRKQVNLITLFEEENEPNIEFRNDPKILQDLLAVGEIFHKLKYDVYIVGAVQQINPINYAKYWKIIPHKFVSDYNDIVSKYSTNTTWIYINVDFDAQ